MSIITIKNQGQFQLGEGQALKELANGNFALTSSVEVCENNPLGIVASLQPRSTRGNTTSALAELVTSNGGKKVFSFSEAHA